MVSMVGDLRKLSTSIAVLKRSSISVINPARASESPPSA